MKINSQFEILSGDGDWCDFEGVKRTLHDEILHFKLENGKHFKCSLNHQIMSVSCGFVEACFLMVGEAIVGEDDLPVLIDDIIKLDEPIYLYDPVNVSNAKSSYIADSVIHHNCDFVGSSYTLINGQKLAAIPMEEPIFREDGLEIFANPIKDHKYSIVVDVSRGVHQDYSAFSVIDCTEMPYKVEAIYKNNSISTLEFPHLIYNTARQYNDAYILIEINDLGEEVANTIWYDYEYEFIYSSAIKQKTNTYLESGGKGGRSCPGVRTTAKVKILGCSILKDLIEKDQLEIRSFKIVEELGVFVKKRASYATSDPIINDDLCTTLWLFAWLTAQAEFKELTSSDLRKTLTDKYNKHVEESMTPFGFYQGNQLAKPENNRALPTAGDPTYLTPGQIDLLK